MSTTKHKLTASDNLSDFAVTLKSEAITLRDNLLGASGFIESVNTKAELTEAIGVVANLKAFNGEIEKTRKEIKEPVLDAGRKIDETAKEAVKLTLPEVARIEKLISDFQCEEMRKAQEIQQAEMRKQMEIQRQQREEMEAHQREIDAAAQKAKESRDELAKQQAEADLAKLKQQQAEREFEISEAPALAEIVIDTGVTGGKVTTKYVFEVTDIHALYGWNRQYVKLEPDRAALNARINLATPGCDIFKIPGIKVTEETKVSVTKAKMEALK